MPPKILWGSPVNMNAKRGLRDEEVQKYRIICTFFHWSCPFSNRALSPVSFMLAADELIRQSTMTCAERGVLMARIRDELLMSIEAYKTMFEAACQLSMRQALLLEGKRGLICPFSNRALSYKMRRKSG